MQNIYLLFLSLILFSPLFSQNTPKDVINISHPEPYELANIILALTDYGKSDKWEVRKNFEYYDKMIEYFKPVENHPLLDSVNYSRERWREYLSFRTDSYAFIFNKNNQLERRLEFYSNPGIKPFDTHLDLINDFVKKSNFRQFFKINLAFYNNLIFNYRASHMLPEMKQFLVEQFGDVTSGKKYHIVLSSFVYRMNCHRDLNNQEVADFITIPNFILTNSAKDKKKRAIEIHNLFTEMDHAYVNPATSNLILLDSTFFNENIWAGKSGYENSNNGVLNEYLTWAVYDIFIGKYFPQYKNEVSQYWHFQNDSRGFRYSAHFANKLVSLYKRGDKRIIEIIPDLLTWANNIQSNLTKPSLTNFKDSLTAQQPVINVHLKFSEPMEKVPFFSLLIENDKGVIDTVKIGEEQNLKWANEGRALTFNLTLPQEYKLYLTLNWWGTKHALKSQKGILLKSNSYITVLQPKFRTN